MEALLFLSGLFTLAAQTVLVREVLAAGGANELVLGILFGAWLFWVGGGALLARAFPQEEGARAGRQALAAAGLYLPGALLQFAGALLLRPLTGTEPGDYFSILTLLPLLLALGAPVSLVTGFLFSRAAAALGGERSGGASVKAYVLEALGSLAGGILFTLWLAAGGGSASGLLLAGGILLAGLGALRFPKSRWKGAATWIPAAGILAAAFWPGDPAGRAAGKIRFDILHPGAVLLESVETPYGLTEIAGSGEQILVFRDGFLVSASPAGEAAAIQAGVLAAQPGKRERLLFLGAPAPDLLADLLAFPWKGIVAVDPDRKAREAVGRRLPGRVKEAFLSPRVTWVDGDPRPYLEEAGRRGDRFDLVVAACPDPGRAASSRTFTREALFSVRRVLSPGGVFALGVPLVERAFDREKLAFGLTLTATLENVFSKVELVPGVFSWFLASRIDGAPTSDGKEMEKRLARAGTLPAFLPRGALASACDPFIGRGILDFLHREEGKRGTVPIHSDARPSLFFAGLAVETRYRDPGLARVLAALGRAGAPALAWPPAALLALVLVLLLSSPPSKQRFSGTMAALSVSAAGGTGVTVFLVLLLSFQCKAGLLFEKVGLASGLFLAGMASASWLGGRSRRPALLLAGAAGGILLLSLPGITTLSPDLLLGLFPLGGLASGLAFPAGAALLGEAGFGEGRIASSLEAADHLGAALGGAAAGVLLVPILGMEGTARLCGLLVLGVLAILLAGPGRPGSLMSRAAKKVFPGARLGELPGEAGFPWPGIGFAMLWVGIAVAGLVPVVRKAQEKRRPAIPPAAARLLGGERIVPEKDPFPHAEVFGKGGKEPLGVLFATSAVVPDVYGYAGPIDLLVAFDEKGIIRHVQVLSWEETPSFVEGAAVWLRKAFVGKKVGDVFVLRGDTAGEGGEAGVVPVDGMAGATITSRALVEIMTRAGKKAAALLPGARIPREKPGRRQPLPLSFWYLLLAFPTGLVLYLFGGKRTRKAFLLVSILAGGFWFALQLAPATLVSAWLHGFSPRPRLFLLVAGALGAALLAGPVYCTLLCPFGALQEMCSGLRLYSRPPSKADRYFRSIKYFLLFLVVLWVGFRGDQAVLAFDPLAAAFGPVKGTWTTLLLLLIGLGALLFFRFWCRYLCPLGAFFQLFTRTAVLLRLTRTPVPAKCDTGIVHPAESDCLHCGRCLTGETLPRNKTYRTALPLALFLGAALFLMAGSVHQALVPAPRTRPLPQATHLRKVDKEKLRRLLQNHQLLPHPAKFRRE